MLFRPAQEKDARRLCEIYAPYVLHTAITFADTPLTEEDFLHKIASPYPIIVCEEDGRVLGYAYAARFREKEAYRLAVEPSIYVDEAHHGRGIGKGLMKRLISLLHAQHFQSLWSCITLPNDKSIALHRHLGFREVGLFPNAGYKLGKWRDVIWLHLPLCPAEDPPAEPVPFQALDKAVVSSILSCE